MFGLLRPLEPTYVADQIMAAISSKKAVLMMPWATHLGGILKAFVSPRANDWASDMLGMSASMDHFKQTRTTNQ